MSKLYNNTKKKIQDTIKVYKFNKKVNKLFDDAARVERRTKKR